MKNMQLGASMGLHKDYQDVFDVNTFFTFSA